jgi:L-fuconolactonase
MANPPPRLLLEPVAGHGLAAIERAGLSFDVYAYHTQLGEVVQAARRHPGLTIVLNHVGGVIGIGPYAGRRDEVFSNWRAGMAELAHSRNVRVKLSGLGMRVFGFGFGDGPQPPSSPDLATAWSPYIETCIEMFGADRCMFGSNFPVDKGTCSYRVVWNAFKRIVSGASEREKTALFAGAARDAYRLVDMAARSPPDLSSKADNGRIQEHKS